MGGQLLAFLGVSAVLICTPGPDTALTVRNALAGGRRAGVATAAGVATGQAVWTIATAVGIAELLQASEPAFLVMKAVGAAYLVALGLQSLWSAVRRPRRGLWTTRPPEPGIGLPSRLGPLQRRVEVRRARVEVRRARGEIRRARGEIRRARGEIRRARAEGPRARAEGPRAPAEGPRCPAGHGPGWVNPGRGLRQGVVSNLANPKMAAFFLSLLPQFASAEGGAGPVLVLGLVFCLLTFGWLALYSLVVDRARVVLRRTGVRRVLDGVSGLVLVGFGARLALPQR